MEICNGAVYENNWARACAGILGTCAPMPTDADEAAAYRLLTGVYECVASKTSELGLTAVDDVFFDAWEQQKGREKDIKAIRDPIAKVEALAEALYHMADTGEIRQEGLILADGQTPPSRLLNKVLALCGVKVLKGEHVTLGMPAECAHGLKKLAVTVRAQAMNTDAADTVDCAPLYFSRCVFDPAMNWTARAFDRMMHAEGRLEALCAQLEACGYRRVVCRDGQHITLDYIKQYGKKEEPIKKAWAERTHAGIEVSFEELKQAPCFLWLRLPMFKTILENISRLSSGAASFLTEYTKTCNGCRYCVQTDTKGTRPLAAIPVNGQPKCPLFAGFNLNWRTVPPELPGLFIQVLDALPDILK